MGYTSLERYLQSTSNALNLSPIKQEKFVKAYFYNCYLVEGTNHSLFNISWKNLKRAIIADFLDCNL